MRFTFIQPLTMFILIAITSCQMLLQSSIKGKWQLIPDGDPLFVDLACDVEFTDNYYIQKCSKLKRSVVTLKYELISGDRIVFINSKNEKDILDIKVEGNRLVGI